MKRYVERDGKFYARVTYIDSSGKERQVWRRAENKSDAKELAKELERQLKIGTEPFEHKGNLDEYAFPHCLDKKSANLRWNRSS